MPPRRASLKLDGEAGLRLLVEEAADLLSRHAPDGVYRYASPAAARLLGYEPEELVGRPVFELLPQGDGRWLTAEPHLCGADHYSAELTEIDGGFLLSWQITGPRKNERLSYRYLI